MTILMMHCSGSLFASMQVTIEVKSLVPNRLDRISFYVDPNLVETGENFSLYFKYF